MARQLALQNHDSISKLVYPNVKSYDTSKPWQVSVLHNWTVERATPERAVSFGCLRVCQLYSLSSSDITPSFLIVHTLFWTMDDRGKYPVSSCLQNKKMSNVIFIGVSGSSHSVCG